jgi:hypothetical protein
VEVILSLLDSVDMSLDGGVAAGVVLSLLFGESQVNFDKLEKST